MGIIVLYRTELARARGFPSPPAARPRRSGDSGIRRKSVFYQPDPDNPDGYLLPFHLDTKTTSAQAQPSTSHAYTVQHSAWHGEKMDNWLPAHLAADGVNGPYTMGYLERDDIPFQFALAENFTICDNYHCSMLGPTWPNRLYHMCAWIDPAGAGGGPIISNIDPTPYEWMSCTITGDHFGIWTTGPATVRHAADNVFVGVAVPVAHG